MTLLILMLMLEPVRVDHIHEVELNHYFDKQGRVVLDQLIYWRAERGDLQNKEVIEYYILPSRKTYKWATDDYVRKLETDWFNYYHRELGMPIWLIDQMPKPVIPFDYAMGVLPVPRNNGQWHVTKLFGGKPHKSGLHMHIIVADRFRETWTSYDREMEARKWLPIQWRVTFRQPLFRYALPDGPAKRNSSPFSVADWGRF